MEIWNGHEGHVWHVLFSIHIRHLLVYYLSLAEDILSSPYNMLRDTMEMMIYFISVSDNQMFD